MKETKRNDSKRWQSREKKKKKKKKGKKNTAVKGLGGRREEKHTPAQADRVTASEYRVPSTEC